MDLISCPECEHHVSSRAVSCPQCGFPFADELKAAAIPANAGESRLFEIAYRQKLLTYALVLYVLTQFPILTIFISGFLMLALALIVVNVILEFWCVYKLGRAIQMSLPVLCLCLLGLFIPGLAWVSLLVVNARAIEKLQAAGVPVGLMGASFHDIP